MGNSQTAVSALQSANKAMATNFFDLANAMDIGHKSSRTIFNTLVANSGNGVSGGTQSVAIQEVASQGILQNSNSATHLALAGNGFFVTSAQRNSLDIQYTRAAATAPDKNGDLQTSSGAYLLGFTDIDDRGNPLPSVNQSDINSLKRINVNRVVGIAKASENLSLTTNLPSGDAVGAVRTANVKMFDALGARHNLTMTFTRTAITPATWNLTITSPDGIINDGTTYAPYNIDITYDGQGQPTSYGGSPTPPPIMCEWDTTVTNADPTLMNFDMGAINTTDGITCKAGDFNPVSEQDGREFGTYRNVSIDSEGRVSAVYSNGQTLVIARIVLANFAAPNQLEAQSGTSWIATDLSGSYVLSLPNTGGIGKIQSYALESSTVDQAEKLTELIELNNYYAANTKSITADRETFEYLIRA